MTDISNVARLSEPLKFAYWVPNVSGGLVVSTIEQRTGWDFEYNKKLARIAENSGFEYALTQTRYAASYGADKQHEATSFSLALLAATERLKVISAVHPGMWHPGVLAKFIITADHISNGRAAVNIVSGWLKDEFDQFRPRMARARRALRPDRGIHQGPPRALDRAGVQPVAASTTTSTTSPSTRPRWTCRAGRTRRSSSAATPRAAQADRPAASRTGTSPTARTWKASRRTSPASWPPSARPAAGLPAASPPSRGSASTAS